MRIKWPIYLSFDPLTNFLASQEGQVISFLDKLRSLMHDKDKVVGRVSDL